MATNLYQEDGRKIQATVATTVNSGDPGVLGTHTPYVALTDADSTSGLCTIDTGGVYTLNVAGKSAASTPATVTAGDMIFYTSGATCSAATVVLNKYATGYVFGIALSGVTKGAAAEIPVKLSPIYIAPDSIATADIDDDAVTLDKLVNITRGSILAGGAANAPTELAAKTSGQILVGDGTDLKSVAVSGDATLSAAGALTIAADAVESSMIDETVIQAVSKSYSRASVLTLYSANTNKGLAVLAAPGADKVYEFCSAVVHLDYDTASYTAANTLKFNIGTQAISASIASTFLKLAADTTVFVAPLVPTDATQVTSTKLKNQPLYFSLGTASPTSTGTPAGTLEVRVAYRVHDLS